jgi:hypothetical protein
MFAITKLLIYICQVKGNEAGEKKTNQMTKLSYYAKQIIESTGCKESEVAEVEDIMRNDVLHSTLDWLTKPQFKKAAKDAYEVYLFLHSETGKRYVEEYMAEIENKY